MDVVSAVILQEVKLSGGNKIDTIKGALSGQCSEGMCLQFKLVTLYSLKYRSSLDLAIMKIYLEKTTR